MREIVPVPRPRHRGFTDTPEPGLQAPADYNSSMAVSPWADHRASIDGKQFELFVAEVLSELGAKLDGFGWKRRRS